MWCLTLATNAAVTWTTEDNGLASPRCAAPAATSTTPSWPTSGRPTHSVDVAGELAKLGSDGYRPLRTATAAEAL
jgi:hypothetical protein